MIGIGVDVVDLERFAAVLVRRPRIAERICTDAERDYCERGKAPAKRIERYAARFAVKEAVHKALGAGLGSFKLRDVEVVREESGEPSVVLHGGAAELAAKQGITAWHVSIAHDGPVAVAFVLAE